ncbi:DEKNAAC105505 [Brettanomyces naardenensis]|uniref:DEKNAAC105505 n=1 Tax=Brettanomyces naardenensis TaxID=13370 RepID=A0A448YU49_BRENA|nr:DEKNAAC105505 [Brettanomyces naardenensis]
MILDEITTIARIPDYEIGQNVFLVQIGESSLLPLVVSKVRDSDMAPYYHYLYYDIKLPGLEWDQSLYDLMKANNDKKVKELQEEIAKLDEEDEGELEILKKWIQLAEYYASIGDKENTVLTIKKTIALAPSTGSKIDLYLTVSRVGFFYDDKVFTKRYLDEANSLIEKGGDWERRNRYKTYMGIYLMSTRKFEEAAKLLIDCLSTFTSTELASYEEVAQYSLICGSISLSRPDLKKKLLESPEILSINSTSDKLKPVYELIQSLYSCEYKNFFPTLLQTSDDILTKNKYLAPHANYYKRELRCQAYSQLLESYKSISLKSMAQSFGVSVNFLDADLCKFIPSKKLSCVIDRVNGVIETNRADNKNTQYHVLIRNGDALLTKLQKYGAAVRLSGAEKV